MQRFSEFYSGGAKYALRAVVLFSCSLVAILQLSECFGKLRTPPISTQSRVQLNESMVYPALTLCRVPAYKGDVLQKYNLGSELRYTSEWQNFPFDSVPLQQFWDEVTFNASEVLLLYGLNKKVANVAVRSATHFYSGQCHTLVPLAETASVGLNVGFSVLLSHGEPSGSEDYVDGWNVYVHDRKERWSEKLAARQDSLFLEVGEELHVKLAVHEFHMLDQRARPCDDDPAYGSSQCQDLCQWRNLTDLVGCGAPWLHGVHTPHCRDYDSHKNLIVNYSQMAPCDQGSCCGCRRPCVTSQFMAFVVNRKAFLATTPAHSLSQLYVFFSSKMVPRVEEREAYDWSVFLADLGGTLGFLLGLSVLGLISLMETAVAFVAHRKDAGSK